MIKGAGALLNALVCTYKILQHHAPPFRPPHDELSFQACTE